MVTLTDSDARVLTSQIASAMTTLAGPASGRRSSLRQPLCAEPANGIVLAVRPDLRRRSSGIHRDASAVGRRPARGAGHEPCQGAAPKACAASRERLAEALQQTNIGARQRRVSISTQVQQGDARIRSRGSGLGNPRKARPRRRRCRLRVSVDIECVPTGAWSQLGRASKCNCAHRYCIRAGSNLCCGATVTRAFVRCERHQRGVLPGETCP